MMRRRLFLDEKIDRHARRSALYPLGRRPMRMLQRANMRQVVPERRNHGAAQRHGEEKASRTFDMRTQRKHICRML